MTEITDFGRFHAIYDRDPHVIYYENEDGQDWYDMQWALASWDRKGTFINSVYGVWAMVDDTGILTCVDKDPTKLSPNEHRILGIDASEEEIRPRMTWDGSEIT